MIILQDRNAPRGTILMPMRRAEWTQPSRRASLRDPENQTRWRIRAVHPDDRRRILWQGWFDDREDADAFILAHAKQTLQYERELWELPVETWPAQWHPDIFGELIPLLAVATVTFLTTTGAGTYTSPSDWNNSNNFIEGIGGGGSGAGGFAIVTCTGAGGGEYRKIANFTFATPGTTTAPYVIGIGGALVNNASGNAGADTTFNTSGLVAKAGQGGVKSSTLPVSGGVGGTGGTGSAANANGGNGGTSSSSQVDDATGGGGAGGPNGAGNSGVNGSGANQGTNGGSGDAGFGGNGGPGNSSGNATAGSIGTEWDPSHGPGGGGGGSQNAGGSSSAGDGGLYGAGGGGCRVANGSTATSGAGAKGLLVVTYTPLVANSSSFLQMF